MTNHPIRRPALPARLAYAALAYLATIWLAVLTESPRGGSTRPAGHYVPWVT